MAAADELIGFVRESLSRGVPRGRVESLLIEAGWSRDQVDSAVGALAELDSPVPVPRPRAYLSAREAFIYLLLFAMLYVSAYNLGALLFDYINRAFPDPVDRRYEPYASQAVRWALASLIVAFPVFAWLQRSVNRQVRLDPAKRRSHVRRWLTYLTVFIASCVIIGDVTTLLYNALAGELTVRFILKVLTIGVIAGAALLYYLSDLRLEDTQVVAAEPRWHRPLRVGTVVGGRAGRNRTRARRRALRIPRDRGSDVRTVRHLPARIGRRTEAIRRRVLGARRRPTVLSARGHPETLTWHPAAADVRAQPGHSGRCATRWTSPPGRRGTACGSSLRPAGSRIRRSRTPPRAARRSPSRGRTISRATRAPRRSAGRRATSSATPCVRLPLSAPGPGCPRPTAAIRTSATRAHRAHRSSCR